MEYGTVMPNLVIVLMTGYVKQDAIAYPSPMIANQKSRLTYPRQHYTDP